MRLPLRNFQPASPSPLAAPKQPQRPRPDAHPVPSSLLLRLLTFSLFKDAPLSFHAKVASNLRLVQYTPKEYIIKEGDPALLMYWILKGEVSVLSTDGEAVYAQLQQGAYFGEIGILFNRPRTATVVSKLKVLVGVLTADALNCVLRLYPIVERRIRDEAQERLAMQEKRNKADVILRPVLAPANVDQTVLVLELVKALPLFASLPLDIVHRLALAAEPVHLVAFDYVFHKNDPGADIYFVVEGEVEVVDRAHVLARLRTGAYFGEMSFLLRLQGRAEPRRLAAIRLVTAVELLVIRLRHLELLCQQFPAILHDMRRTATLRRSSNEAHDACEPACNLFANWLFSTPRPASPHSPHSPRSVASPPPLSAPTALTPPSSVGSFGKRRRSECLPEGPLDIVPPPQPHAAQLYHQPPRGAYMPHSKRMRLASMAGRRRSSVLVSTGLIPDKVLLKTFEYLLLPELMRLRRVSRRWRQLLYVAPNLFARLNLLPWNTSLTDGALVAITDFVGARPQYVDISNCFHITDEGFSYMVNEIGLAGTLRGIRMRSVWEVSAMAIMDLASPRVGRHLEYVDLAHCRNVTDNVVERLVGWAGCGGSQNLTTLDLGYCKHLTDGIIAHIAANASDRLESLDLARCTTITDAGFECWMYTLFPRLHSLSLKDCTFLLDKTITAIGTAAPQLRLLDLSFCCALLDGAVEVLCLACPNLEELNLSFCGSAVSDSSLVSVLLHLRHLKKLDLRGCVRVTRAGVDALLSGFSLLNHLNISQCRNAHMYPGQVPAQVFQINPATRSAFITAGPSNKIIEIVV